MVKVFFKVILSISLYDCNFLSTPGPPDSNVGMLEDDPMCGQTTGGQVRRWEVLLAHRPSATLTAIFYQLGMCLDRLYQPVF